ncbi:hypothetical protein Pcinc_005867 [Petrolisthes cinctipes]|uniref:Uncharacterized protein n=1 Tax=Petrolisthes cinctipes TaxID=88211 RepID=A0AAE1GE82_PETCI|nr:hypothetical protein Pcinc_005867 [Petrolisthes cinctipes]
MRVLERPDGTLRGLPTLRLSPGVGLEPQYRTSTKATAASNRTQLTSDKRQQVNQRETAHPPQSPENIAGWRTSEGRMARDAVYGPPRRSSRPVE